MSENKGFYKAIDITKYLNKKGKKGTKKYFEYRTRIGVIDVLTFDSVKFRDYEAEKEYELLQVVYAGVCDFDGEDLYNSVIKIDNEVLYVVGIY